MPAKRKTTIAVSYHKVRDQYYKQVGYRQTKSGKVSPAKFWLGPDRSSAEVAALKLVNLWEDYKSLLPYQIWIPGFESFIKRHVVDGEPMLDPLNLRGDRDGEVMYRLLGKYGTFVKPGSEPEKIVFANGARLHAALDAFGTTLSNSDNEDGTIKTNLKRIDALKGAHGDCNLADLDFDTINALGSYWLKLPKSKAPGSKGCPISPSTAATQVKLLRRFCRWLDATEASPFEEWRLPRRFDQCLKVSQTRLERRYADLTGKSYRERVRTFSDVELGRLWNCSTERMKTFMLIALNSGATQGEIASMRINEFDFTGEFAVCERDRKKTMVFGRFRLFDETARRIKQQIALRLEQGCKSSDLLFVTENGSPLTAVVPKKRDRIANLWAGAKGTLAKVKRHYEEVPKPRGFKYLRKTGAQYFRDHLGDEVAGLYLSHKTISANDLLDVYANKNYKRLDDAMPGLESYLEGIFQICAD